MKPIGKILSTHGVKGYIIAEHTLKNFSSFEEWDALMVELLPGSRIPFFIKEIKKLNENGLLVKLEEIHSPEAANEILGKNIYLSPNADATKIEVNTSAKSYIGYTLFDNKKEIGIIDNILNPDSNPLFLLHEGTENELLIPANEELILNLNHDEKIVYMNMPDGLI